jgi:hypothetical protein
MAMNIRVPKLEGESLPRLEVETADLLAGVDGVTASEDRTAFVFRV